MVLVSRAIHRYAPTSSTKICRVAGLVRGLTVGKSIEVLRAYPNRGARMIEAVIASAAANAANAGVRNVDNLTIAVLTADGGPMRKRIRAKSRGMAYVERNRTTHISCALAQA